MELRQGWLSRQAVASAIDTATWPEWMRREARFDDKYLTPDQRKRAAELLRKRADELDPQEGK